MKHLAQLNPAARAAAEALQAGDKSTWASVLPARRREDSFPFDKMSSEAFEKILLRIFVLQIRANSSSAIDMGVPVSVSRESIFSGGSNRQISLLASKKHTV